MEQAPNTNNSTEEKMTVEQLEAEIVEIDMQLMNLDGNNLTNPEIQRLGLKKAELARQIALMKGEEIEDGRKSGILTNTKLGR